MMNRKTVLALVAVAAMGIAAIPADAFARGGHGGGGGMRSGGMRAGGFAMGRPAGVVRPMAMGSFTGGGMRVAGLRHGPGFRHHHHHFRRFAFVGPYYSYWDYPYPDGCYQVRRVLTPYGWRWRRVDVCS